MKIYTKKGDKGTTSLFGGGRVAKSDARIEAYGTVDELNSLLGLVLSYSISEASQRYLLEFQKKLFVLGADLATPSDSKASIRRITEQDVTRVEEAIDILNSELPELKNFILPGGTQPGATLHVARTVCRRAERAVVACSKEETVSDLTIKFLNRLSDFLFVVARYENKAGGTREVTWQPEE